jgi:tRNA 2-thiocytidine biosynthesis protein TtcA
MLNGWDEKFPGRLESMFTAMQNIVPSHLADTSLFDFKSINKNSGVIDGGDIAFDKEEMKHQPVIDPSLDEQYYQQHESLEIKELT